MFKIIFCVGILILPRLGLCADQTKIDLGGGRIIVVPVPDGFRPLGNLAPAYRDYVEKIEAPRNMLLEIFLTPHDLAEVIKGHSDHRDRELKIDTLRESFGVSLNYGQFDVAVADDRRSQRSSLNLDKIDDKYLSDKSAMLSNQIMGVSKSKAIGKFLDQPYAVGIATCHILNKHNGSIKYCLARVALHVLDRGIILSVGVNAKSDADILWMESTASLWARNIVSDNKSSIK